MCCAIILIPSLILSAHKLGRNRLNRTFAAKKQDKYKNANLLHCAPSLKKFFSAYRRSILGRIFSFTIARLTNIIIVCYPKTARRVILNPLHCLPIMKHRLLLKVPLLTVFFFFSLRAYAHPHVFIDAEIYFNFSKAGLLQSISEDWRYDPIFSASVVLDFAKENGKTLSNKELKSLTHTIHDSVAYYHYFQNLTDNGKNIALAPPYKFSVALSKLLTTHLENKTEKPLILQKGHRYLFTLSDPTYFVFISYKQDKDIHTTHLPAFCRVHIIRPDANEVLAQAQQNLTEAFFTDPTNAFDIASQLAQRIEIVC